MSSKNGTTARPVAAPPRERQLGPDASGHGLATVAVFIEQ
jgi:hypothetical protein